MSRRNSPWRRWRKHSTETSGAACRENPDPICRLRADFKGGVTIEKDYRLALRLSEAEKTRLETDAKRCGLNRSAYLRRLILGAEIRASPSEEIKKLRTEIHHIGNNINQIARSVNAGIASREDARHGLFLLDKVYDLLYDHIY